MEKEPSMIISTTSRSDPSDNKVFPPLQPLDDLVARSHENLEEARPVYPEVSPCPNGEEFCELLASYPRNFIDAAINRS
ncbi:Putative LOC100875017, partial [Caligus rogercresseyi]